MHKRYLRINVNFSWHLVWIFALLEGVTVPLVPLCFESGRSVDSSALSEAVGANFVTFAENMAFTGAYGMSIGFIGTLTVCLLLNYIAFRRIHAHLDSAVITRVAPPLIIALWGGLLLAVIFWIQQCISGALALSLVPNLMAFGFVSAAGSIIVTGFIYMLAIKGMPACGIQLITTERRRLLLAKVPIVSFATLIGLYEALAAPILHIWELVPQHKLLIALLMGLLGGALSSFITVTIAHIPAIKQHLWVQFSEVPANIERHVFHAH
ncbi:hypothetical protein [Mycobacterium noviomagense]|uniref:hypothetical protein n=1 Tax=Mycobacterium noviomagense TaxID=459858 RepID=UPI00111C0008|nr:hypothetical protein [Mycobacterium noviomagense]